MLTPREAAKETGLDYRTLVDGARGGKLRAKWQPTRRGGEQPMFELATLREDLAFCTCTYPDCDEPAPGRSGRCGSHRARGEPAIKLICQNCGKTFTRPVSWLAELEGRGHYCSNPCKGVGTADPRHLKKISAIGAKAASEHQRRVDQRAGELGITTSALAAALRTSASVIRATAPQLIGSEVVVLDGSPRLIHPADAVARYPRAWVRDATRWLRRSRFLDPEFMVKQQDGLGRLERVAEERALRDRVAERRRLYLPKRAGRHTSQGIPAHHLDWAERFEEIRENYESHAFGDGTMPSDWQICLEVAVEDFVAHPERWSYDPSGVRKAASNRVRKAIKALLIRETEIIAA